MTNRELAEEFEAKGFIDIDRYHDEFAIIIAALRGNEQGGWKSAAQVLGEHLAPNGPDNYYEMTCGQWLIWARPIADRLNAAHPNAAGQVPNQAISKPYPRRGEVAPATHTLAELDKVAHESFAAGDAFRAALVNAYRAGRLREVPPVDAEIRRMTYAERNPLGGPATRFEAVASRLRAGDDYAETLKDFWLADVPEGEYICTCGIRVIPHRCPTGSDF